MRAAPTLVLALLALAPALAAAQAPGGPVQSTLSVYVEDPGRALMPGTNESLVVGLNYDLAVGAVPEPGDDPTSETNASRPTRVTLTVTQMPSWILGVTFDPPIVEIYVPPERAAAGVNTPARALAIVQIAPDAPALEREDIVVEAVAEPNGNIAGSGGVSPPIKLRADVVSNVNVTAPTSVVVPGGRWTPLGFTVRNDGNDETKVLINVTAKPQESEVRYPESITLARGESAIVEIELRLPWTVAEDGIVEMEATPLTEDGEGTPARAEIDIRGTSAVPAPGLAPFLVGLLVVARLARRGR